MVKGMVNWPRRMWELFVMEIDVCQVCVEMLTRVVTGMGKRGEEDRAMDDRK